MNALALVARKESDIPAPVALYVEENPVSVLLDENLRARFFAEIEQEIDAHVPDLTTVTGRKAIASLAYKVACTKTAIDAAGKKLNDDANAAIKTVNAKRNEAKKKLEALQDRARKPLNEWEEAEAARLEEVKRILALLQGAAVITTRDTAATITARISEIEAVPDEETYAPMKTAALEALRAGHTRIVQDEADRAELAKLKAEKAARDRDEAERVATEQRAADEAAREERAAQEAKERDEAVARRAAADAEAKVMAAAQAEIDRLAAETRTLKEAEERRQADERRKAEEDEKRQQNVRHRAEVIAKAKAALMANCGLDEETAAQVVVEIANGLIPNVSIQF